MSQLPAILGGDPVFAESLPFARPTIEEPQAVLKRIGDALESGYVTNGPMVRELEERVAESLQVEHCVAVASCTLGLVLVIQALQPSGPVVMPSFTFSATAHAAAWNAAQISFADCDRQTWTLGPEHVSGSPSLIVGVHVSGVPCDVDGLTKLAKESGAEIIFDAAHGAGSMTTTEQGPRPLGGFGRAEVFSLTPTKVLSGAEGGLVATNDAALAEHMRLARDYGNPGDYDTLFNGLNARLSEPHAAMALQSLDHLAERVAHRNAVARRYHDVLGELPGVDFQAVPEGATSSYKDFSILIDRQNFGCDRDEVVSALHAEGVQTRKYYFPPVHRQTAYKDVSSPDLPVTNELSGSVVSLPIWSHLPLETVDRVGQAMHRIHSHAAAIAESGRS